jgi:YHS domain-containing protein
MILCVAGAVAMAGCESHDMHMGHDHHDAAMASENFANAVDLGNTVCPVAGDKIEGSGHMVAYEGKVYHFCCDECPAQFKKDPAKYAKLVSADPAKYGVKKTN